MPEVNGYKYAYSVGQINDVLEKINNTGKPIKLTITHLQKSWLLKNAQYSSVLEILRGMEFISQDGTPTKNYDEFRNPANAKRVLAEGIKKAYPTLFATYPNANDLPKETLEGFINQHTGADPTVVAKIYGTIKRLCTLADFTGVTSKDSSGGQNNQKQDIPNSSNQIPITMNIQIVVPNDATAEQYDKIFTSIKKNLLGK